MKIHYLNAFTDNYIWCIRSHNEVVVIDPGDALPVIDYITANKLNLSAILLTHSHDDHIGGVAELVNKYQAPTFGMLEFCTKQVNDEDKFDLFASSTSVNVRVIKTPGHTYDGVCYLITELINGLLVATPHLFCGDTLFAAGCGRVFTGDYTKMYESLTKIKQLPYETKIYPAHEYTLQNLRFVQYLEPESEVVASYSRFMHKKLNSAGTTLPTTLNAELAVNPFLRTNDKNLIAKLSNLLGHAIMPGLDTFIKLRELRNQF